MKYKIYRLVTNDFNDECTSKRLIQDEDGEYFEFDTIEEAHKFIKVHGNRHCNYTILPYIYLEDW